MFFPPVLQVPVNPTFDGVLFGIRHNRLAVYEESAQLAVVNVIVTELVILAELDLCGVLLSVLAWVAYNLFINSLE